MNPLPPEHTQEADDRAATKYYNVFGYILQETPKAVRLELDNINGSPVEGPRNGKWFPISQLKSIYRGKPEEFDCIQCPEWILKKEGYL